MYESTNFERVGVDLGDEGVGNSAAHNVRRPCGVTVRPRRACGQNATPTRNRPFAGGTANSRRSDGGRAWQVRGSASSRTFPGLDAHRHSLAATPVILTRRKSQLREQSLGKHFFSVQDFGILLQPVTWLIAVL